MKKGYYYQHNFLMDKDFCFDKKKSEINYESCDMNILYASLYQNNRDGNKEEQQIAKLAREKLILNNLKLVTHVAKKKIQRSPFEFEDLIQYGMIGLIHAADNFDPTSGYKFSTYACIHIKQSMCRAEENFGTIIRNPSYICQMRQKINKAIAEITANGEKPTPEKISELTNIKLSKVKWVLKSPNSAYSYNILVGENETTEAIELMTSEDDIEETVEKNIIKNEMKNKINYIIEHTLTKEEQKIIELRFYGEYSLSKTSKTIGKSISSVRELEKIAINKIREKFKEEKLEEYLS